jgi:uncharacterized protein YdiU (UPF0061 family)
MALEKVDYNRCFRTLCDFKMVITRTEPTADNNHTFIDLFADKEKVWGWCLDYSARLQREGSIDSERQQSMRRHNPKYILRNYLVQKAIIAAQQKDYREIDRLLTLVQDPYEEHPGMESYAASPAAADKHLSISCSS